MLEFKKKKDSTLFIKFLDLKFLKFFFFFHLFTQIRRNILIKYIKKEKKKSCECIRNILINIPRRGRRIRNFYRAIRQDDKDFATEDESPNNLERNMKLK